MNYIGIDPGLDGAVAVIDVVFNRVRLLDVPTLSVGTKREYDAAGMAALLREFEPDNFGGVAVIESVHSMPEQGVASSFAFGKGLGIWLGILAALQIPHELVTPQRWKKTVMDGMAKEKDASRQRAIQLFPAAAADLKLKKHHGRADALLMAEFKRRVDAGRAA